MFARLFPTKPSFPKYTEKNDGLIYKPHSVFCPRIESTRGKWMIIYLGSLLPTNSCSLPEAYGDEQPPTQRVLLLLGLASDGGCLADTLL